MRFPWKTDCGVEGSVVTQTLNTQNNKENKNVVLRNKTEIHLFSS